MNAKDFRIQNLIKLTDTGEIMSVTGIMQDSHGVKVFGVTSDGVYCNPWIEYCEPIPLTNEWLVKLGFKKNKDKFYAKSIKMGLTLEISSLTQRTIIFNKKRLTFEDIKNIIYVHQLQNLYFALTGEELEVKP